MALHLPPTTCSSHAVSQGARMVWQVSLPNRSRWSDHLVATGSISRPVSGRLRSMGVFWQTRPLRASCGFLPNPLKAILKSIHLVRSCGCAIEKFAMGTALHHSRSRWVCSLAHRRRDGVQLHCEVCVRSRPRRTHLAYGTILQHARTDTTHSTNLRGLHCLVFTSTRSRGRVEVACSSRP